MVTNLSGKIAVVTGSSRGIGRKVAIRLGANGAAIALVARGQAGLEETAGEIRNKGGHAEVFPADLSQGNPAAIAALTTRIQAKLGIPAILINAAGIFGPIGLIKNIDMNAWLETIAVNALTPSVLCQALVGGMIAQKWGRIVNFTSAASLHTPGPINSAYGTSKVALNQFTRHLASELTGTGVTANVIHPGDVKTEMWEDIRNKIQTLGPEAEDYHAWVKWVEDTGGDDPEKSADLVLNLMSDSAASVNGQFLWIENGLQAPIASWGEPTTTQPWHK